MYGDSVVFDDSWTGHLFVKDKSRTFLPPVPTKKTMALAFRHHALLLVILLTTLLAFQAAGWLTAWNVARMDAHFSAQQILFQDNTPVSSITLLATDLPALRVGKREIRLNGGLYDIRSTHVQGDSVRLELYHDWHEEQLFKILSRVLSSDDDGPSASSALQIWLAKWLGASFLVPQQPICPTATLALPPGVAIFTFLSPAAQSIPGTFSPPPEGGFLRVISCG